MTERGLEDYYREREGMEPTRCNPDTFSGKGFPLSADCRMPPTVGPAGPTQ